MNNNNLFATDLCTAFVKRKLVVIYLLQHLLLAKKQNECYPLKIE